MKYLDTKIKIELDRSSDEFVLLKEDTDPIRYKLKILELAMYIPVGQLSQSVYNEINSLQTLPSNNPITFQFRRLEIRPLSITKNSQEFHSELLFTEDVPARIVVFFVETSSKSGSYSKNPFNFQRKWKVPKQKKATLNDKTEPRSSDGLLEKRLLTIESVNRQLLESLRSLTETYNKAIDQSKGKGRGKKSSGPKPTASTASTSSSITRNLRTVSLNDLGSTNLQSDQLSESAGSSAGFQSLTTEIFEDDPDPPVPPEPETTDLYIKSIQLLINGNVISNWSKYYFHSFLYLKNIFLQEAQLTSFETRRHVTSAYR